DLEKLSAIKLGIERDLRRGEVNLLDERGGFGGAVFSIHSGVLPFDAQGALVVDVVEGDDDFFEVDVAVTEGAEVPVATGIRKRGMTTENANCSVAVIPPDVFHVDVEDSVFEGADELDVVDALVAQV